MPRCGGGKPKDMKAETKAPETKAKQKGKSPKKK